MAQKHSSRTNTPQTYTREMHPRTRTSYQHKLATSRNYAPWRQRDDSLTLNIEGDKPTEAPSASLRIAQKAYAFFKSRRRNSRLHIYAPTNSLDRFCAYNKCPPTFFSRPPGSLLELFALLHLQSTTAGALGRDAGCMHFASEHALLAVSKSAAQQLSERRARHTGCKGKWCGAKHIWL